LENLNVGTVVVRRLRHEDTFTQYLKEIWFRKWTGLIWLMMGSGNEFLDSRYVWDIFFD
jgi:hypothetical protein